MPSFFRSAGARFATTRRSGNSYPELRTAARTRSRASDTAASDNPTIEKAGSPFATSTSTVTSAASSPQSAHDAMRATVGGAASAIPRTVGAPRARADGTADRYAEYRAEAAD